MSPYQKRPSESGQHSRRAGVIARWRKWLPVTADTPVVTLGEGDTPLVEAPTLSAALGAERKVFLKVEGDNPTGSFKDRGMTLAVSKALESGSSGIICASTGNTSASAAAYGARAGLPCWVVLPAGKVAAGKLAQALVHGARLVVIQGNFDGALALVRRVVEQRPLTLVNSLNPWRVEGQKSAALEVVEELGTAPAAHLLPVGNAGNITATWRGYQELKERGRITATPRMLGFQASGAAPLVTGQKVENPQTMATAIRIGNPTSAEGARQAVRESDGAFASVSDAEIL
ncbi:MAG: threonine synthase, partial [Planctomycetota bacterium]